MVDPLAFRIVPRSVCLTDYPFLGSSLYSDTVESLCYLPTRVFPNGLLQLLLPDFDIRPGGLIMGLHRPVPVCIPLCNTQVPLDLPNKLVRPDYRYLLPSVTEAVAVTQAYFPNFVVGGI